MSDAQVRSEFNSKLDVFLRNNNQTMLNRINELTKVHGYTVTKVYKVSIIPAVFQTMMSDFNYTNIQTSLNPVIAVNESIANSDQNAAIEVGVEYSKTLEEEYSYTFTEGILVGVSVQVGFNGPVTTGFTANTEIKFEANHTWTKKEIRTWAAKNNINIDPGHSTNIQVTINNSMLQSQFVAKLMMNPRTFIDFQVEIAPGGSVPSGTRTIGLPASIFKPSEMLNNLSIPINGYFSGVAGVDVVTKISPNH